jgi:hypothetical protein
MEFHVPQVNIKNMEKYDETFNDTCNESKNNIDSSQSFKPLSRKFRLKDLEVIKEENANLNKMDQTVKTDKIKAKEVDTKQPTHEEYSVEILDEPKPKISVYKSKKPDSSKVNEKKATIKKNQQENKPQVQKNNNQIKSKKDDDKQSNLVRQMKDLTVSSSPTLISSNNNRFAQDSLTKSNEIS